MRRLAPGSWLLAALALGAACAHHNPTDIATLASSSDKVIWEAGQKALKGHDHESARQHFKRIVDAFPQSQYGPSARLALADSYLHEGGTANDILAIAQYREFLTLYPSHAQSDYAQFQIGECYYKQKNGPDRDQTNTEHALDEYQRLLELYPSSQRIETARGRIVECRQSLATSEFLAGYFYQRTRQAYRSAIGRYEAVLNDYPDFTRLDEVLYRLGECLILAKRPAEALPRLKRLLDDYPKSTFADSARQLMEEAGKSAPAPPAPAPSAGASPAPQPTPTPTPSPRSS